MPRQAANLEGVTPSRFLSVLRDTNNNLLERYKDHPVELAEYFGIKLPRKPVLTMIELGVLTEEEAIERFGVVEPGLRELVEDICTLTVTDAVAVANRGGGKSYGVSFIEFYLWMVLGYDALNLGGSELQADQVYQYLLGYIEHDEFWLTLLRTDPQRERTYKKDDAWVRVLTASQKSVRSPHAGGYRKGRTRGGVLVIDEEAEAEADIVEAALPTIDTARPSVSVRCSTFHNLEGSFQEVVDHHEEMGYKLYRWDIFDVAEPCECVDGCQSEEPCFREDHVQHYVDPDTGHESERLVHRAYCGGRAKYADGWIPMTEIVKLWKRMRRNHSRWEVEAMGSRPSTSGFVIKDLLKHANNVTPNTGAEIYMKGAPVTICVDWGTSAAGVGAWQEQPFGKHALVEAELIKDNNETQIIGAILALVAKYNRDLLEIAADIGGGGNYFNPMLRDQYRLPVRDVNFNTEKEAAVGAWNIFNENEDLILPAEFEDFHHQCRNWKRKKDGTIRKANDHLCDMSVCFFAKFVDQLGISMVRVAPQTFAAGGRPPELGRRRTPGATAVSVGSGRGRGLHIPMVRTFGNGSKKRK